MLTTEDHDERITTAYRAREDARKALAGAADALRAEVLASDYTAPELSELLGFSVSSARQLILAAKNGRMPRTYAGAKKPTKAPKPAKGPPAFSVRITVGYVDQEGKPAQLAA